ncbi:RsmE family RNA methyltransferase [Haliovirga abyssi]|uniref:Ribosomal RNA small subunit methyltransferase E n=1 Tax=Haliovirga abyssi TaxID=2996794 RepID=A0AAU9DNG7_9FUSO|nr:RsmE family RNA methyltransferase [Haliovirga abyssi]BDU49888.1 ribosomal RNA small subunit methyltransferase E [Haliovirga abyssi]
MITVVIDKNNIEDNVVRIKEKSEINHLKNVLRGKVGAEVRLIDGEKEYFSKISDISKKEIKLEIYSENKEDNYSVERDITAAISIIKSDNMDLIIQKLTEIGIKKIVPIITNRVVVKLKKKKERWGKISKEALKQCRGIKFVEIEEPKLLKEFDFENYNRIIVPYEKEKENKIKNLEIKKDEKLLYFIGPEGGFEEEEILFLKEKGAETFTLGKRILRAETAAIVVGGILSNEF